MRAITALVICILYISLCLAGTYSTAELNVDHISYVRASRATSDQVVGSGAWADLVYNTEAQDVLSEFNTTTGVFTATYAGLYQINASATFQALNDQVEHGLQLLKITTVTKAVIHQSARAGNSSVELCLMLDLATAETVKLQVIHWHGSDRDILSTLGSTVLTIHRVVGSV